MFLQGPGSDRGLGSGEEEMEAGEPCLQVTDGFGTSHPRLFKKALGLQESSWLEVNLLLYLIFIDFLFGLVWFGLVWFCIEQG